MQGNYPAAENLLTDRIASEARSAMEQAINYREWVSAAEELDRRQGLDDWKDDEVSEDYDWRLVRSRLRQIRQYRAASDVPKLVYHLRQGLHWNLGNTGNPQLYAHARFGTKRLVRDYVTEVSEALKFLCTHESPEFTRAARLRFFHETALSYGRSALMLSGGATLGLFHVGVVKALYLEKLLPIVMSGSSAGSVVTGIVGSRAPHDVESLLDPNNAYYHFWRVLPFKEMLKKRAVMDQNQVRVALSHNMADLTFEEAYKLSGRIANITVSPAGSNQPPRLLNYLTFPYLYLREAVMASCAVPLLFPPVQLMTRDEDGQRSPYMPLLRWNDGSLKSDLPTIRLRRLHNVNHFIVSQTNPHVIPFVSKKDPAEKQGVMSSARAYAGSTLRGNAKSLLDLARGALPLGPFGRPLETASSILDQNYRGNINIFPDVSLWRYINVTSNPNLETVKRFMLEGERAAWPRIEMIRNQTLISTTLDACVDRLEQEARGVEQALSELPQMPKKPGLRVVRTRE